MVKHIGPIGVVSVFLVALGYILLGHLFDNTSDEEINRLIFYKKKNLIISELLPIFDRKKHESYNKLVLRLG